MSHRKVKNFLTLGLILLAIGVAVWGWGLVKRKKELHQLEAQLEMLDSDSASAESGDGTGMSFDFSTDVLREQIGHEASGRNLTTQEKIGKLLFYVLVQAFLIRGNLPTTFRNKQKSRRRAARLKPAETKAKKVQNRSLSLPGRTKQPVIIQRKMLRKLTCCFVMKSPLSPKRRKSPAMTPQT
ncbi:MAG: hypothetical protein ACYSQZ_08670 [Planctomycetota bacterium]|jgi:hypothetical protein